MYYSLAMGASVGYNAIILHQKQEEVQQGKNHYQAALFQAGQIITLTNITGMIVPHIPYAPLRTAAAVSNAAFPLAGMFLCPLAAAVKQGHYETGAQYFNQFTGLHIYEELSSTTKKISIFLADHGGKVTSIGMVIGAATLPLVGSSFMAGAMLAPMAFKAAEAYGYVPSKVSLAAEKYMPLVTNFFAFLGSGVTAKIIIGGLSLSYFSSFSSSAQRKIEGVVTRKLGLEGPSLEDIDAPLIEHRSLSFEHINWILDAGDEEFEINAAHCSRAGKMWAKLREERDFRKFYSLFDSVNWKDRYLLLRKAFRDDERFLEYLGNELQIENPLTTDLDAEVFDDYLLALADINGTTKEDFLARQLKKQFEILIKSLCYEVQMTGSKEELEEAIQHCSKILAFLIDNPSQTAWERVEMEDILLKLAVEGGEYCARGVKRAGSEILCGILLKGQCGSADEVDPVANYEQKLNQHLESMRYHILQATYQKIVEALVMFMKEGRNSYVSKYWETTDAHAISIAQDVHTLDLVKCYLSLGFYPLSEYERNSMGMTEIMVWASAYREIRNDMYAVYHSRLDEAMKEIGEVHFGNYLRQLINAYPALSEDQKEAILDKYIYCNNDEWCPEVCQRRFHRLVFVTLGVLTHKALYADWVNVPVVIEEVLATDSLLDDNSWEVVEVTSDSDNEPWEVV